MASHRALERLHAYGRRYPWAWEAYARLLADPPAQWPSWCWCPLAGAYAVISRGGTLTVDQAADIGPLGALAAWRATQGIYRVHSTLLAELLDTPVAGDIPADVLTRLPEWCVYIETPGQELWGIPLHGYWAYLEHDLEAARAELRLVLDLEGERLGQIVVHLVGTLEQGLTAALREARVQALRGGHADQAPPLAAAADVVPVLEGLVSVLLYLCADDAEIGARRPLPERVVRGRKRPIMPAPQSPTVHETGVRLGAALDFARDRASAGEQGAASERRVAPHVRRAHWHTYWTGPRDGERRATVRWLSPILVGLDGAPESATVRAVE